MEKTACLGTLNASRMPNEKCDAQNLFKLTNLRAEGRLRDMELLCSPRHIASFDNADKVPELTQIHAKHRPQETCGQDDISLL